MKEGDQASTGNKNIHMEKRSVRVFREGGLKYPKRRGRTNKKERVARGSTPQAEVVCIKSLPLLQRMNFYRQEKKHSGKGGGGRAGGGAQSFRNSGPGASGLRGGDQEKEGERVHGGEKEYAHAKLILSREPEIFRESPGKTRTGM